MAVLKGTPVPGSDGMLEGSSYLPRNILVARVLYTLGTDKLAPVRL